MTAKEKYIGKYVHAGGELNGAKGVVVDVKENDDEIFGHEVWLVIDSGDGMKYQYEKCEVKEILPGFILKDLD